MSKKLKCHSRADILANNSNSNLSHRGNDVWDKIHPRRIHLNLLKLETTAHKELRKLLVRELEDWNAP